MSKELKLGKLPLIIKTDYKGNFTFANSEFQKITGYDFDEIAGHNILLIQHNDMPQIIYDLLWEDVKDNNKSVSICKKVTKNGDYFWVFSEVSVIVDHSGIPSDFTFTCSKLPKSSLEEIEELYKAMKVLEKDEYSSQKSKEYLDFYLKEKGLTFSEYMRKLGTAKDKGLFSKFF